MPDRGPDPVVKFGSETGRFWRLFGGFGAFVLAAVCLVAFVAWVTGTLHGGIRVNVWVFFLPVAGWRLLHQARSGTLTYRRDTQELVVTTKHALTAKTFTVPARDVLGVNVITVPRGRNDPDYELQLMRRSAEAPVALVQTAKIEEAQAAELEVNTFLQDHRILELVAPLRVDDAPSAEERAEDEALDEGSGSQDQKTRV